MGTNYYIFLRGKKHREDMEKYFLYDHELTDDPDFGYLIHIGKRSAGWKPLFEDHHAYHSVKELLELLAEHPTWEIADEYGEIFTVDGLKEKLINWEQVQIDNGHHCKLIVKSNGDFDDFKDGDSELNAIMEPIDHVLLDEIESRRGRGRGHDYGVWHDPEGYDFTRGSFA